MKVLIIGSGGREHALAWKLAQSPRVAQIWVAPGNGGMARDFTCAPIRADALAELVAFARQAAIDLTVVGPEAPLLAGIVPVFEAAGLRIIGPTPAASEIEGSKGFAKALMAGAGIPTAAFRIFDEPEAAFAYIRQKGAPIVVKADGLAAGKGVVVARTVEEALSAVQAMMVERIYGAAGARVVIEECLEGEEASLMAVTDGETVLPLAPAQDHKRLLDGDQGPNTGGMGAYSPVSLLHPEVERRIVERIIEPAVAALARHADPYRGVLYAGVILTAEGPKALEFNARLGDPEAQVVLPRLDTDLLDLFEATLTGQLGNVTLRWKPESSCCVVLAAHGYPGTPRTGDPITGLEEAGRMPGVHLFHAGTRLEGDQMVTAGGRVLGVTALGKDLAAARERAYEAAARIHFEGMHYRKDIGARGLQGGDDG